MFNFIQRWTRKELVLFLIKMPLNLISDRIAVLQFMQFEKSMQQI